MGGGWRTAVCVRECMPQYTVYLHRGHVYAKTSSANETFVQKNNSIFSFVLL